MKRFWKLLRKDLEGSRVPTLFLSGIILALMAYVRYRIATGAWIPPTLIVAVAVPTAFCPLWLIWRSFQSLRTEWREDTIYTLLTLPAPGWQIMLAKVVSLCLEYTILYAVTAGGTFLFFGRLLEDLWNLVPSPGWLAWNLLWVYAVGLVIFAGIFIHVQLAFVVGKMVGRFQGLVYLWVLVLTSWIGDRLAALIRPLFIWLPTLRLHEFLRLGEVDPSIILEWHPAGQIGLALAAVGFLFVTGYLFEHFVEIN